MSEKWRILHIILLSGSSYSLRVLWLKTHLTSIYIQIFCTVVSGIKCDHLTRGGCLIVALWFSLEQCSEEWKDNDCASRFCKRVVLGIDQFEKVLLNLAAESAVKMWDHVCEIHIYLFTHSAWFRKGSNVIGHLADKSFFSGCESFECEFMHKRTHSWLRVEWELKVAI